MIELKHHPGFDVFFTLQTKFELNSPISIGVLLPTRRGFNILTNVSPTQFRITVNKEKSERG
jgi:hypothetical protein